MRRKNNLKILAVIPARAGSKRLKNKNIRLVKGKPMISYAINSCKKSRLVDAVYVVTESERIAKIAGEYGARVVHRPKELALDHVPTQDVFEYFANSIKDFDILVSVQANSPNVQTKNIDQAIQKLIDYDLWEVRSVNSKGLENGAIWALKRDAIFWGGLSVYFGVILDDSIDIHTIEDLKRAEELIDND